MVFAHSFGTCCVGYQSSWDVYTILEGFACLGDYVLFAFFITIVRVSVTMIRCYMSRHFRF